MVLFYSSEGSFYADAFEIGKDENIYTDNYKKLEKTYGKRMIKTVTSHKLKNILLAGTHGQITYSAKAGKKFPYLGKNLIEGTLKKSKLAACFNKANDAVDNTVFFSDFEYSKMMKEVVAYFCVKQFAEFDHLSEGISKGDVMGVVLGRIDMEYIDSFVSSRKGMGNTGQVYAIGDDRKLRTNMYVKKEKYNLLKSIKEGIEINTESVNLALEGKQGQVEEKAVSGATVISVYYPVQVHRKTWAFIADKQVEEIEIPVRKMLRNVIIIGIIIFIVVVIIAVVFGILMTRPLDRMAGRLDNTGKQMKHYSGELSTNSQKMSASAQEQASSLEAASTMEEVTSTVKQTADNSQQATQISQVADIMSEISSATKEQYSAFEQINRAVTDLDSSAQNNSMMAQQTSGASDEIRKQSDVLNTSVERLKGIIG